VIDTFILAALAATTAQAAAPSKPHLHYEIRLTEQSVDLALLPNGHVRFDNGPAMDLHHLRLEILRMSRERPRPAVRLRLDRHINFAFLVTVLKEFQQAGYDRIGFTAARNSN
jgi:biopolymer transport protein ExbD